VTASPDPGFAWIDGRLLPASAATISAWDRGFGLGDGVFETLRACGGRPVELTEHLERLERSAAGLAIRLPDGLTERLRVAIAELLAAEGLAGPDADAAVRITLSRGPITARGLLPPDIQVEPTAVVQAWPVLPPRSGHLEVGLGVVTSQIRRDVANPLVALKTTSRADYVMARLEARQAGADDAIFLTLDGRLSEATSANVFLVRPAADDGAGEPELATPGLDCAVLPGTTRSWLLAWAVRAGLRPREIDLRVDDLRDAAEAFLSSSVAGILPLTSFAGGPIGDGRPGSWTLKARAAREAFIRGGGGEPAELR
jgi:branched-subunit amino acid aminotransferase/4-amino-4-deoxychorismate lyase